MPNTIAKKFNITLDTIKQNIIRDKNLIAIMGDSIEITINITENNQPKDISGVTCRLIGTRIDGSYFEQTEKIEVVDGLNGVVKIYPRLNVFNVEGQTICGLIIEDIDESINVQRFMVNVSKSMVSDIITGTQDEIATLKRLNDLLNAYQSDLTAINQSVVDMEGLVTEKTNKVNTDFQNLSDGIQTQVNSLQNSIDGVNNTVNYELTKAITLKQYQLLGSSFIYFESEPFNVLASELLNRSYMVFLNGIVDLGTHNASVGVLSFYRQNSKIYVNYLSLSDRVVNNKSLSPSVTFGDLTSEILPSATGFKLMVKSNILKSLNTETSAKCILTPIGNQN